MFVRYECPRLPNLTMYGVGGKKQFTNGSYITDDPVKQEFLESRPEFGCWIFKTGESENPEALSLEGVFPVDRAKKKLNELTEVTISEDGSVVGITRTGSRAPVTSATTEEPDITAEQELRIAFLNAGFDPGTDIHAVLDEMGIQHTEMSAEAVLEAVMPQLRPLMRARMGEPEPSDEPEAPKLEPPNKTTINRANHDQLIKIARVHDIDITSVMASAKTIRAALLEHFHGKE